jgi:hypothetical protein
MRNQHPYKYYQKKRRRRRRKKKKKKQNNKKKPLMVSLYLLKYRLTDSIDKGVIVLP